MEQRLWALDEIAGDACVQGWDDERGIGVVVGSELRASKAHGRSWIERLRRGRRF